MPANIDSMMYVGAKPWHGLGTRLENAATSEEAIVAAGLDWRVSKKPLFLEDGTQVPKSFATVREDSSKVLGVVGKIYDPLQNKDAFRFFDAVVGIKEAMYNTAGSLGNGECVWILAKLPGIIRVKGDDVTEKYLLLTNRHDGLGAASIMFTPIRVVCQNTLNVAITQPSKKASLRHTASIGLRVEEVRQQLGIINAQFGIFEKASQRLASTPMTKTSFANYIRAVGLVPQDMGRTTARARKIMEDVSRLFETGKGADMPSARGTAWGAFNSVIEYADFIKPVRTKAGETNLDARAKSILFGSGADLKQRAWDTALSMA